MATVFTKKDFDFSCIYKLTSPSGKIYIGQTQCLYLRFRDYRKPKANEYLMKAILKYGLENISVEILEKDLPLNKLDKREQFYLDILRPFNDNGYNICKEASTTRGRKRPKDERSKISEFAKTRIGELNGFYGKTHTEETKKLIGRKSSNKTLTKKHIESFCGAGQDSVKRKVKMIDAKTNKILKIWDSIKEASDNTNALRSTITAVCRGYSGRKTAGGYKWEYV
jgi:group I intron endonuclease